MFASSVIVFQAIRIVSVVQISHVIFSDDFFDVFREKLFADKLFRHQSRIVRVSAGCQETVNIQHIRENTADCKVTVRHVGLESLVQFPSGNEDEIGLCSGKEEFHVRDDS